MAQAKQQYAVWVVAILVIVLLPVLFIFHNQGAAITGISTSSPTTHRASALNKLENKTPSLSKSAATALDAVIASTPLFHDLLVIAPSLEGTSIDGALMANAEGELILNIELRDFFDYFLSTADEIGPEQSIAEIQRYAQTYLPEPAKSQALDLLAKYLRYKRAEYELQQTPLNQSVLNDADAISLLTSSFEKLKNERQNLFSPEQDHALFYLEDSYAQHTLSSLSIMANEHSTDQQKREQLKSLEARLPVELANSFEQTKKERQQQSKVEALLNSSQDDAQLYQQLEQEGLAQAQIESIIIRRQQQRQFNENYKQYQQQKSVLKDLQKADQSQINRLRKQFFTNPEDLTQAKLRDLKQGEN